MKFGSTYCVVVSLCCLVSAPAGSGPVDVATRTPFAAGTALTADALNQDFDRLRTAIDGNAQDISGITYTTSNFVESDTITSKVFERKQFDYAATACTSFTWNFTRPNLQNPKEVTRTEGCTDTVSTSPSAINRFKFTTNGKYELTSSERSDGVTATLNNYVLSPTLVVFPATLRIGETWSDATLGSYTNTGVPYYAMFMRTTTLIAVEDRAMSIASPPNNMRQCLKILSQIAGFQTENQLSWFCDGLGEVERYSDLTSSISSNGSAQGRHFLLTAITPLP